MTGAPTVPAARLREAGWERFEERTETLFRLPTLEVDGHTVVYGDAALRATVNAALRTGSSGAAAGARDALGPGEGVGDRDGSAPSGAGRFEGPYRFFFATALSFSPPLPPGVGPASVRPSVVTEATAAFEEDLEARGFVGVERGRRERTRVDTGDRATLRKFTAAYPLGTGRGGAGRDGGDTVERLDVEGWVAVWSRRGSFRVAGGAYPVRGLTALLDGPDERSAAGDDGGDGPATGDPGRAGTADGSVELDPSAFREELFALVRAVE